MNKKMCYLAAGVLVLGLTGCSKKLGQFKSDYFSTVPTPLETVGEMVPGTVKANIPSKFMVKNAKVSATPVIQWATGAGSYGEASPRATSSSTSPSTRTERSIRCRASR